MLAVEHTELVDVLLLIVDLVKVGELVDEAVIVGVLVIVLVVCELLVLVGQAVEVLDGFIDLDILADELLVLELDILEVSVFEIFIVFVLNEVLELLGEPLDVLEELTDLVTDTVAVEVFDNGGEPLIVGDADVVLEEEIEEDVVLVLMLLLVLDGLEVAVLDDVVVVDGKGEDELVFETVPVLVEVWELGIVFDI